MDFKDRPGVRQGFHIARFLHAYYDPSFDRAQETCINVVRDDNDNDTTTLHVTIPKRWMNKDWR